MTKTEMARIIVQALRKTADLPAQGWLQFDDWAGRTQQKVLVIGETPNKLRIEAIQTTRLAGKCRYLFAGQRALVPKHAVTFEKAQGAIEISV